MQSRCFPSFPFKYSNTPLCMTRINLALQSSLIFRCTRWRWITSCPTEIIAAVGFIEQYVNCMSTCHTCTNSHCMCIMQVYWGTLAFPMSTYGTNSHVMSHLHRHSWQYLKGTPVPSFIPGHTHLTLDRHRCGGLATICQYDDDDNALSN